MKTRFGFVNIFHQKEREEHSLTMAALCHIPDNKFNKTASTYFCEGAKQGIILIPSRKVLLEKRAEHGRVEE